MFLRSNTHRKLRAAWWLSLRRLFRRFSHQGADVKRAILRTLRCLGRVRLLWFRQLVLRIRFQQLFNFESFSPSMSARLINSYMSWYQRYQRVHFEYESELIDLWYPTVARQVSQSHIFQDGLTSLLPSKLSRSGFLSDISSKSSRLSKNKQNQPIENFSQCVLFFTLSVSDRKEESTRMLVTVGG